MRRRRAAPPTFESVYRRAYKSYAARALYFAFCCDISKAWGLEYGREQSGHSAWIWSRNECATEKETVKALCRAEYHRFDGLEWKQ